MHAVFIVPALIPMPGLAPTTAGKQIQVRDQVGNNDHADVGLFHLGEYFRAAVTPFRVC